MSTPRQPVRLAVSCLVSLALLSACGSSGSDDKPKQNPTSAPATTGPPSLQGKETLLVGLKKGQPGFSTKHGNIFEGFEADLSEELAGAMNFEPDYRDIESLRREKILEAETADLIIATYSITPGRDKDIDFTAPYFKSFQGLLVRDGDDRIKELNDVDGKRVCTAKGSTSDPDSVSKEKEQKVIRETLGSNVKPGLRNDYKDCVREMRDRGNFDAVWTDKILLKGFERDYEGVHVIDHITVGSPQFYGVGLRQGDKKFCERLNKAVRDFVFSADWRAYFKTHFDNVYREERSGFASTYRPTRSEFDQLEKDSCGAKDTPRPPA